MIVYNMVCQLNVHGLHETHSDQPFIHSLQLEHYMQSQPEVLGRQDC